MAAEIGVETILFAKITKGLCDLNLLFSLWVASRVRFAGLTPALDPTHRAYFVPGFMPPPDLSGNRQPFTSEAVKSEVM